MNRLTYYALLLAAASFIVAGPGWAQAETIDINEFSGTFDEIQVLDAGSRFKLLDGAITVTQPDSMPAGEQLTISDVIVDLSGYDDLNGGSVSVLGDSLTINNATSGTSANLTVDWATLTQVLNPPVFPIGMGYVSLALSLSSSDLETGAGDTINLNVADAVVTMNGLQITTDGSNGTATLGTASSASISAAVPEPSTLWLTLLVAVGVGGYGWRRRSRACS